MILIMLIFVDNPADDDDAEHGINHEDVHYCYCSSLCVLATAVFNCRVVETE